jgi:hypothetical protein
MREVTHTDSKQGRTAVRPYIVALIIENPYCVIGMKETFPEALSFREGMSSVTREDKTRRIIFTKGYL